ncbi:MAG: hypothetical protein ACIALR_07540, partial [Blastopirellula sp. JB062]
MATKRKNKDKPISQSSADKKPVEAMRVDGPHVSGAPSAETEQQKDDVVAQFDTAELSDSQRRQLEELSGYLRQQRADLERRETQLQSQWAAIDNEARVARLGVEQQAAALAERTKQLDRRELELDERDAALHDRQNEIEAQILKLDQQAGKLEQTRSAQKREDARLAKSAAQQRITQASLEEKTQSERRAIDRKLAEAKAQQAALEKFSAQLQQRERQLQDREAALDNRKSELEVIAAELADSQRTQAGDVMAYSREQAELSRKREAWEADQIRQRDLLEQTRERGETELIQFANQLDERQRRLEQRQAAVEKIESELREKHREALESQLVVAELWPD